MKIVTWAVIVIVVVGGIWYFMTRPTGPASTSQTSSSQQSGTQSSNTSDSALTQDMSSIDTQVDAAGSANTSAQSFSDTQVQQTE